MSLENEEYFESLSNTILTTLNKMIKVCEPIKFSDFNKVIKEKEKGLLEIAEREDEKIGIRPFDNENDSSGFAISTASIVATITDICIGKRLAFEIDEGYIIGFKWYEDSKNEK
jgi:hypothetical protein